VCEQQFKFFAQLTCFQTKSWKCGLFLSIQLRQRNIGQNIFMS